MVGALCASVEDHPQVGRRTAVLHYAMYRQIVRGGWIGE